jgi:CheY-like chemotaxis protein
LLADDHPLIRLALRRDLEMDELEICAEARTSTEAVKIPLRVRPGLCLLDLQMPEGGSLAATEAIRRSLSMANAVLITAAPRNGFLAAAHTGADGHLAKDGNLRGLPGILCGRDGETPTPRLLWLLVCALAGRLSAQAPERPILIRTLAGHPRSRQP